MKVFIGFLLCVVCAQAKVTPDYFPSCKKSDPQIEKCFLNGLEAMKPYVKDGIPELNIPALDPFNLPTLKLDRTGPNLRIKATIKHAVANGGSNYKIEKLKLNLNNKYAGEVKLTLPRLMVVTNYDVQGSQILTLEINGKGRLRGNFTGITVVVKGTAKPIVKEGVEYLQIDKLACKLRINDAQIAIDESERPLAASSAVSFFNANPNVVLDLLNPLIEETTVAVIKKFLNKTMGSIPLTEVLTDG